MGTPVVKGEQMVSRWPGDNLRSDSQKQEQHLQMPHPLPESHYLNQLSPTGDLQSMSPKNYTDSPPDSLLKSLINNQETTYDFNSTGDDRVVEYRHLKVSDINFQNS